MGCNTLLWWKGYEGQVMSGSQEPDESEFRDDSVRKIATEFQVPRATAATWERNIGSVEILEKTLGMNGPENYLDLICRREWIPLEQEGKEKDWFEPVQQWSVKKADDVFLVHDSDLEDFFEGRNTTGRRLMGLGSEWFAVEFDSGSPKTPDNGGFEGINWSDEMLELQAEIKSKKDQVQYEMKRFDSEWIGLARELRTIEQKLEEIYKNHLQNSLEKPQTKKDQIVELKSSFPYLRANNKLIAKVTDCSVSYASQFKGTSEGAITNRKVSTKLQRAVIKRDNDTCVSCGSRENLVAHHIVPHNKGGETSMDNLALLCEECHHYAHGGRQTDGGIISGADWGTVEYSGKEEFWNNWIYQEFSRPSK